MKAKEKSIILNELKTAYYQYYESKKRKSNNIIARQTRIHQTHFHATELERLCRKLGFDREIGITKEFCYREIYNK